MDQKLASKIAWIAAYGSKTLAGPYNNVYDSGYDLFQRSYYDLQSFLCAQAVGYRG